MSPVPLISRRSFITGGATFALSGCVTAAYRDPVKIGETSLKERASRKGLRFGAAVHPRLLLEQPYASALIRDAGVLVPGNALKWGPLARQRDAYNFDGPDAIAGVNAGVKVHHWPA